MDTTKAITHVSLCAGYGGIDLGLKRAIPDLRTVAFSEIEAFACANLVSKMEAGLLDPAPIWTDLKTFPWSEFHGRVDILSGGYPCQPFSAAGKRLGAEDPRHLWPHISAGIAAMRPSCCFFENVEGHISLGLPDVLQDLAGMGYRTTWGVFSASEVGAPHQRKRIFILAHDKRQRVKELGWQIAGASQFDSAWNDGGDAILANSERASLAGRRVAGDMAEAQGGDEGQGLQRQRMRDAADHCGATPWPSRPGERQFAWEPPRVVGAVPTKLADFCAGNEQPGHDAAPASSEGAGQRREGADADADGGSSVCGGDQGNEPTGTLADTKGQRAGQRSELRSEECGSRGALPWDVEQSGKGDVADHHGAHAGHGEQRPEWTSGNLSGGCGEAMGNAPQRQDHGREPGDVGLETSQGRCGDHAVGSAGEGLGNAQGQRPAAQRAEHEGFGGQLCAASASSERELVDAQGSERRITSGAHNGRRRIAEAGGPDADADRQTQPSLGRDPNGLTHRLDDAVLHVTTDNRTDELRLLGNGVVPATAERAFRVLVGELWQLDNT